MGRLTHSGAEATTRKVRLHAYAAWRKAVRLYRYCVYDVWDDTSHSRRVALIKTLNLAISSFTSKRLQQKACALTYSTVLAVVPTLAMLFAIGRGFGFQNMLQSELFRYFPAQRQALESALMFVDRYLEQASQGVFVGIGMVFLLWTLVSLMRNVEHTFNEIWGISKSRTIYRQVTDYTVMFILLPVLMLLSAGVNLLVSNSISSVMARLHIVSPLWQKVLDLSPMAIAWVVFVCVLWLIPNTRVKFKCALWPGVVCGTLSHALQLAFVSGQIYVSKYNAVYGTFAFLPLLLIWLQLVWLITLSGVAVVYSIQNVANWDFSGRIRHISPYYASELAIALAAVIATRFTRRQKPLAAAELALACDIPPTLTATLLGRLLSAGVIAEVSVPGNQEPAYQPALSPVGLTVDEVAGMLGSDGCSDFACGKSGAMTGAVKKLRAMRRHNTVEATLTSLIGNERQDD